MNKQKLDKILQLIMNNGPQRKHFFRKLAEEANPVPMLEPLESEGCFTGDKNPEPVEDPEQKGFYSIPYWEVLGFLENVAKQNAKSPSDATTKSLLEIIDGITTYENPKTKNRVENYHTDVSVLRIIGALPIEVIEGKHIDLVGTFIEARFSNMLVASVIGKRILDKLIRYESTELLLRLLRIILGFRINPKSHRNRYEPGMDKFWLRRALEKYKPEIARLCSVRAAEIAIEKIEVIIRDDEQAFNPMAIPSIEDHEQNWQTESYPFQLVVFVRDMLGYPRAVYVKQKVRELLAKEHRILKRIGIWAVNKHYRELKELFWEWHGNPLEETKCRLELYNLVKDHCEELTEKETGVYVGWVESIKYPVDCEEETIAFRRKEWLLPFKNSQRFEKDERISKLYEKYHKIHPEVRKHPGWLTWHETAWGRVEAFDEKDFLGKTAEEQVVFLNKYRFEKGWRKPEEDDLAYGFQQVVAKAPEQFAADILVFRGLRRDGCKLALLRGLGEAWDKENDFDWEHIFDYCDEIVGESGFWRREYKKEEYDYRRAFIKEICSLIKCGIQKDSHAFEKDLLPRAEKILLEFAKRTIGADSKEAPIIQDLINSTKYNVLSALIEYSRRYARVCSKKKKVRWPKRVKEHFEACLDKEYEPSLYYSATVGMYLALLKYLDGAWVTENINHIFPKTLKQHWEAAFCGYVSTGKLYDDIYVLLRDNGDYQKALQFKFRDDNKNEQVVQHICLGYLNGREAIDDPNSLISQLASSANGEQAYEIIHYVWGLRESEIEDLSSKVKALGMKLYKLLKDKEDVEEYQNAIRDLYLWLAVIDNLDKDTVEWTKFSVDHMQKSWDALFFVEYLGRHVEKNPEEVADIYLQMLDRGLYPDYKKEDIIRVIRQLDAKGERGKEIYRLYLARGYTFVEEVNEELDSGN